MIKLTNTQFNKFCKLSYAESGIKLTEEKRELLKARLGKRLRALKIDAGQYLDFVKQASNELHNFLDAISTNHTYFFRESKSFKYLDHGFKHIWCAASSSGEEPYSIAAYCMERGFRPLILATDISSSCLKKGKRGIYPMPSVSNIPPRMLKRYFQKGYGKFEGHVRVKESVRRRVRFERFNLLKDCPPSGAFDVIFCRNVMIYFDIPTKELVLKNLYRALRHGGYFIIGGAESLSGINHSLTYVEPSVYRK